VPSANGEHSWMLRWSEPGPAVEASQCNGCGQCRSELPGQRMCPVFRATQSEAATPRAKANLLRNLLVGGGMWASRLQTRSDPAVIIVGILALAAAGWAMDAAAKIMSARLTRWA